ncbi:hypothetical protein [Peribacillus butanolivorans]|uniref:hypothetical protein n=1 Tax=Peribacillus butanolivorans TaxID=421767 RepID=UPI0036DC64B9
MKRKSLVLAAINGVSILGFGAPEASASEYVYFETEDGKYETTVKTTSTYRNVEMAVNIVKINRSTGGRVAYSDASPAWGVQNPLRLEIAFFTI